MKKRVFVHDTSATKGVYVLHHGTNMSRFQHRQELLMLPHTNNVTIWESKYRIENLKPFFHINVISVSVSWTKIKPFSICNYPQVPGSTFYLEIHISICTILSSLDQWLSILILVMT